MIRLVEKGISDLESYILKYEQYKCKEQKEALMVLRLIKNDFEKEKEIGVRVLRGFKDICTTTARDYEEAEYASSIFELLDYLINEYPEMRRYPLLGMDFGKGDPI